MCPEGCNQFFFTKILSYAEFSHRMLMSLTVHLLLRLSKRGYLGLTYVSPETGPIYGTCL